MKGCIKCIKAASNQCILLTDFVDKNVHHEVLKYCKIQDLKKLTIGGVTSNQKKY